MACYQLLMDRKTLLLTFVLFTEIPVMFTAYLQKAVYWSQVILRQSHFQIKVWACTSVGMLNVQIL